MSDYERTFSVRVPPERAFRAFTDPTELEQWFATRFDTDERSADAETPGGPVSFEVTGVQANERLQYRQWAASPDMGIDVTVVFEAVDGPLGSRSRTPASAATRSCAATRSAGAWTRPSPTSPCTSTTA